MMGFKNLGWFIPRYGILIIGFGSFLVGVFFIFQGLIQQREIIEKESRISVWFLAQTEIELLRFTESLKDFELARTPATAQEANERFEIFWSRLPPLLAGSQTAELRSIEGLVPAVKALIKVLEALEPDMQRLMALPRSEMASINARLDELRGPIHDLVRRALLYESNEVSRARERHNELYMQLLGLFGLTVVVGLVIFGLLFRQIVKTNRAIVEKDVAATQAIAARNELELAINSISEGFIVYDQEDRVALFNKRYVDLHPMQADDLQVGVSFSDLLRAAVRNGGVKVADGDVEGWIESVLEKRRGAPEATFESRLSDGSWLKISERWTVDGRLVGVHTDITALKEREQLIEQKSRLLETTLDNMKQGIAVFDADSRLVLFNNQFLTINQYPESIVAEGASYRTFVEYAAERGDLGAGAPTALVRSQMGAIERLMRTRTGSLRQQRKLDDARVIETIASALPTGGIVKTYEDITDRIDSEAERSRLMEMYHAAQKTQALGTLAGGIAHDFNNIIGGIVGNCSLLMADSPQDEPTHARLRLIMDSGTRARDLVRQILTFSRNAESLRKPLDLSATVQESLKTLRPLMPNNVALRTEGVDPCYVAGDATQIHQIILNVCINAAQAIGDRDGRVSVSIQQVDVDDGFPGNDVSARDRAGQPSRIRSGALPNGAYARITIIDTGCGIPEEVMPRIFEPFYTTKEVGDGTGLGLAAVQGIVRSHEGCIEVESLPGVGTRVDVYLPAISATLPVMQPKVVEQQAPQGSERILLVDDDRILLAATKEILMRLGYTVEAHNEPQLALSVLEEDPEAWDLVITDRSMPKMNGEELVRSLKGLRPDLPVLMLSGFVSTEDSELLATLGLAAVIGKPVFPDELATAVRRALVPVDAATRQVEPARAAQP
ncbi:MAG: PAS-domain containing protein [Thalassobaculum sp.]|uniref:PAS-domain containing protein n=1 Tax=Thalassobaculum sp. TaxID=2022740 RepID=UPI0032EAADB9